MSRLLCQLSYLAKRSFDEIKRIELVFYSGSARSSSRANERRAFRYQCKTFQYKVRDELTYPEF